MTLIKMNINLQRVRLFGLGLSLLLSPFVVTMHSVAATVPEKPLDHFKAIFVGGPTVVLEIGGLRLMTDPTFDKAGKRFEIPGNSSVYKITGPAIQDVGKIDIVLLSHDQHPDNLDSSGRAFLPVAGQVITTKSGASRLKGKTIGLDSWESMKFKSPAGDDITITAVPARHGPYGIEKIAGTVTGFVIEVKGTEKFQIYISGDTEYFSDIDEIAKKYQPDFAFVFAGSAQPTGPINVTMNTNDVLEVARIFPKALIVPVHCEGWSHYKQHNADYVKAFNILGIPNRIRILAPGEETILKP